MSLLPNTTKRCLRIIGNKTMWLDTKIELLYMIFSENPEYALKNVELEDDPRMFKIPGDLLHAAASAGCPEMVSFLLKFHVDVNSKDNQGKTPIFGACDRQNHSRISASVNIIHQLLEHGAEVNVTDYGGNTPLFYAIFNKGSIVVAELLLHYGADVINACAVRNVITPPSDQWGELLIKNFLVQNSDKVPKRCPVMFTDINPTERMMSLYTWNKLKAEFDDEIELMKRYRLNKSTISVHDIFVADDRKLACCMKTCGLKEHRKPNFIVMFPMCYRTLLQKYREGMERFALEEQATIVMDHCKNKLNFYAWQEVFQYLPKEDLEKLRKAGLAALNER